jgi:hypothetical protein
VKNSCPFSSSSIAFNGDRTYRAEEVGNAISSALSCDYNSPSKSARSPPARVLWLSPSFRQSVIDWSPVEGCWSTDTWLLLRRLVLLGHDLVVCYDLFFDIS